MTARFLLPESQKLMKYFFDIHCYENSKKLPGATAQLCGQMLLEVRSHGSEEGTGDGRLRSRQCRAVIQVTRMPGASSPNSPFTTGTFATAVCPSPCAQAGCPQVPVPPSHQAPCGTQISARPSLLPAVPCRVELIVPTCSPGHRMWPCLIHRPYSRTAPRLSHARSSPAHLRTRPRQPDALPLPLPPSSGVICHQEAFSGPHCAPITL